MAVRGRKTSLRQSFAQTLAVITVIGWARECSGLPFPSSPRPNSAGCCAAASACGNEGTPLRSIRRRNASSCIIASWAWSDAASSASDGASSAFRAAAGTGWGLVWPGWARGHSAENARWCKNPGLRLGDIGNLRQAPRDSTQGGLDDAGGSLLAFARPVSLGASSSSRISAQDLPPQTAEKGWTNNQTHGRMANR